MEKLDSRQGLALAALGPARLRRVNRDGGMVWQLCCPECHKWGDIDDDQLYGRVSVDHTDQQCGFHESHNFARIAGFGALEAWPNTPRRDPE